MSLWDVIVLVLRGYFICLYLVIPDMLISFSGNYGGALGANALANGLEGNKSLRVHKLPHVPFYMFNYVIERIKSV